MKRFLAAIALASVGSVAMAEQQPVMVILSDASPMTQGMAMVLANQMQAQGAQVDILLCDRVPILRSRTLAAMPLSPTT